MDKVVINHIHNNKIKLNFPVIIPNEIRTIATQCQYPPIILHTMHENEAVRDHSKTFELKFHKMH